MSLTGPGGMLRKLTKLLLETAFDAEMTTHLGYEAHDPGLSGGRWSMRAVIQKAVRAAAARGGTPATGVPPVETSRGRQRRNAWPPSRAMVVPVM